MLPKTATRGVQKISLRLILTMVIVALIGTIPALAQATTFTSNEGIPLSMDVFVPCADNGAGELVHLSGTQHVILNYVFDGSGGFHETFQTQPQGVSGIGLTTGDKYQGTGGTHEQFDVKVGFEFTAATNFRIIGQGSGNNLLIHENFHSTITPEGNVTAFFDNYSVECQ